MKRTVDVPRKIAAKCTFEIGQHPGHPRHQLALVVRLVRRVNRRPYAARRAVSAATASVDAPHIVVLSPETQRVLRAAEAVQSHAVGRLAGRHLQGRYLQRMDTAVGALK